MNQKKIDTHKYKSKIMKKISNIIMEIKPVNNELNDW